MPKEREKKKAKTEKAIQEDMRRNPDSYIQPTIVIDPLTRREMVNPEFFKRFGHNPHNLENPHSPFVEISENDLQDQYNREKNALERQNNTITDAQVKLKFTVQQSAGKNAIECDKCKLLNYPLSVHCFYCGSLLDKYKN